MDSRAMIWRKEWRIHLLLDRIPDSDHGPVELGRVLSKVCNHCCEDRSIRRSKSPKVKKLQWRVVRGKRGKSETDVIPNIMGWVEIDMWYGHWKQLGLMAAICSLTIPDIWHFGSSRIKKRGTRSPQQTSHFRADETPELKTHGLFYLSDLSLKTTWITAGFPFQSRRIMTSFVPEFPGFCLSQYPSRVFKKGKK